MSESRGERKITRGGVEALWSKEEVFKMEEVVGAMTDTSRTGVGATIVVGKKGSMEASITGKNIFAREQLSADSPLCIQLQKLFKLL